MTFGDFIALYVKDMEHRLKPSAGEISKDDYDRWRYYYPKYDENSGYVKVPSQGLSDAIVKIIKDQLKDN